MPMSFALSRKCWERGCILPLARPMASSGRASITPPSAYSRRDSVSADGLFLLPFSTVLLVPMRPDAAGGQGNGPGAVASHHLPDHLSFVRPCAHFRLGRRIRHGSFIEGSTTLCQKRRHIDRGGRPQCLA